MAEEEKVEDFAKGGKKEGIRKLKLVTTAIRSLDRRVKKLEKKGAPYKLLVLYDGEPSYLLVDAIRMSGNLEEETEPPAE